MINGADNARYLYDENTLREVKTAFASIAASQTDSNIVSAVASRRIKVVSFMVMGGSVTNTITFNSKPGGAGSAITPAINTPVNGVVAPGFNPKGHFKTVAGEGLTVTTGAGAVTLGVLVNYIEADA